MAGCRVPNFSSILTFLLRAVKYMIPVHSEAMVTRERISTVQLANTEIISNGNKNNINGHATVSDHGM